MSTRALGDSIGVSHTAILQFEKGITLPAVDTLVALADYFDVSVDYLLGVSDEPNPVYKPEHGIGNISLNEPPVSFLEETNTKYKHKTSIKSVQAEQSDQANKKPGQSEIEELIEELDEEAITELRKYAEYLKVRQTLGSNKDESSAGLDTAEHK